jgi:hypothetical protein
MQGVGRGTVIPACAGRRSSVCLGCLRTGAKHGCCLQDFDAATYSEQVFALLIAGSLVAWTSMVQGNNRAASADHMLWKPVLVSYGC